MGRNDVKHFRGYLRCTVCVQNNEKFIQSSPILIQNEDGGYVAYCHRHRPENAYKHQGLSLTESCIAYPWLDVKKLTLHKPGTDRDRKGPIVSIEMRRVGDIGMMRRRSVEAAHALQAMADGRAVIHNFGETGEGNHCWTELNWRAQDAAVCTVMDKYWGERRILNFQKVCRLMAEIHEWELVDETIPVLDRIVDGLNKAGD